ncbi:MAG: hypothetical protein AAFR73_07685 [Pseudomonadota bacterium]
MSLLKPFGLGAVMAAMMLWMGHEQIMSDDFDVSAGAVLFVLSHVVVLAAIIGLALVVPSLRRALRSHRPNPRHVVVMMAGAFAAGGAIHAVMHGVIL